ncbi:non-homologous end-joining DNA ligase [Ornithinimicrobium sp. Arc0846-15]|nr:non-homologous end-joining DNA ligase [Ornithinimicrobium laminariae]
MRPMLATPGAAAGPVLVPQGADWRHEVKWDGVRLLADIGADGLVATSRSGRNVSVGFPEFAGLQSLASDMLLDGEAVALIDGKPDFSHIVDRVHQSSAISAAQAAANRPATFMIFDLLRFDGMDLSGLPWADRRRLLEDLIPPARHWQVPPTYADGQQLWEATAEQGLEGVVCKRVTSRYYSGERSEDWLKFPHRRTQSVVIGGWRPEVGRQVLGGLLVGTPSSSQGQLTFRGRVGSGLSGAAGRALQATLAGLASDHSPFAQQIPAEDSARARWLHPSLVIDVTSLGTTRGGRLRQPSFQRVRTDLTPQDVTS